MPSIAPNLTYGGLASAITTLILFVLDQMHITVPGEVGAAMTTLVFFAISHGMDLASRDNKKS